MAPGLIYIRDGSAENLYIQGAVSQANSLQNADAAFFILGFVVTRTLVLITCAGDYR